MTGPASESDPVEATADAAWRILEGIVDPCSKAAGAPAGLVSMGLVRHVLVTGEPGAVIVSVELGITEPGCMMQGVFSAAAEHEIRQLPGVVDVSVRIDHGYVWDPDDMAAEYRARLSTVRAQRKLLRDSQSAGRPRHAASARDPWPERTVL
jgi:metal-sulfur cluster biosynthetic enzyme